MPARAGGQFHRLIQGKGRPARAGPQRGLDGRVGRVVRLDVPRTRLLPGHAQLDARIARGDRVAQEPPAVVLQSSSA